MVSTTVQSSVLVVGMLAPVDYWRRLEVKQGTNAPPRRLLPRQILIARVHTRRPAVILEKHVPGVADAVELCKGVSIDLNLVFV